MSTPYWPKPAALANNCGRTISSYNNRFNNVSEPGKSRMEPVSRKNSSREPASLANCSLTASGYACV